LGCGGHYHSERPTARGVWNASQIRRVFSGAGASAIKLPAIGEHMHFVRGQPWLLKVACVVIPWCKRTTHQPSLSMVRAPFLLSALVLLSALLPSLLFSVRNRGKTTELAAQMVLFLYAAACIVSALLADPALHAYACLVAQLLLAHLFWSCFLALQRDNTLSLYPQAFRAASLAGVVAVFTAYGMSTPHVDLQVIHTLGALFSAEMAGLAVMLVSSVMRAVATMYEEGLACYA